MDVQRHHIVLSGAVIAMVVMLGFAAAFIADASKTSRTYDALAAHRVRLAGRQLGCAAMSTTRRLGNTVLCRVAYDYRGVSFTEVVGRGQPEDAYVDPAQPTMHMTAVDFDGGPEESTGDLVLAGLLFAGAVAIGIGHELHRHRRRRRSPRVRPAAGSH